MKHLAKCSCFLLAVLMLLVTPAFAVEGRASSYFGSASVSLHKLDSRTFEAWFDVTAVHTMDALGAKFIKIQRSTDDENWTTVATYSKDVFTNLICNNTVAHASYVTYTGTTGYYYRAYIQLYAKDSSGTGLWNRYTSSILL